MDRMIAELQARAQTIRYHIVKMIGPEEKGHLGGSCSIADVVAALYFQIMRHDPKNPKWEGRDRFLLSKGHAALVQYAALAESGYFELSELGSLKELGSRLQGHPDMLRLPGIEANTGSLGQGLSMACGIASALKLDGSESNVYCVLGDGEVGEGQIWEAAMAASFYKLDNLIAILDRNGLQATGRIAELFDSGPLGEKWKSFGWQVTEIDGHDFAQIIPALKEADQLRGKPALIIADTVKGKGIPFAEGVAAFHNGVMSKEEFESACRLLSPEGSAGV